MHEDILLLEEVVEIDIETLLEAMNECPDLEHMVGELCAESDLADVPMSSMFTLVRVGNPVPLTQDSRDVSTIVFQHLTPGAYELALWTGRVVWKGVLENDELVSALAFRDEPLFLAADTGEGTERPTRRELILDGEVEITVYPGPSAGRMEIRRCDL